MIKSLVRIIKHPGKYISILSGSLIRQYFNTLFHGDLVNYDRNIESIPAFHPEPVCSGEVNIKKPGSADNEIHIPYHQFPELIFVYANSGSEASLLHSFQSLIQFVKEPFMVILTEAIPLESFRIKGNVITLRQNELYSYIQSKQSARYLVLLDRLSLIRSNSITNLVKVLDRNPRAGMAVPKVLSGSSALNDAGIIIWDNGTCSFYGMNEDPRFPDYNYVRETDSGSHCSVTRRDVFLSWIQGNHISLDDWPYILHDLSMTIRKSGMKVIYQPESEVYVDDDGGLFLADNGKDRFFQKWRSGLLQGHLEENALNLFSARERGQDKRYMLMIDYMVPLFDKDAGSRTMQCYIDIFIQEGFLIKYVSDFFYPAEKYLKAMQQSGVEVVHGSYYEANLEKWLMANGNIFSVIFLSRPTMAIKYLEMVKKHTTGKLIYYGHDLHYIRALRQYHVEKKPHLLKDSESYKDIESRIFSACDFIYYPSQTEVDIINSEFALNKPIRAIVPYIFTSFPAKNFNWSKRTGILFIGGFLHPPNVDAVIWFLEEVWLHVTALIPDIVFYIIGSDPPESFRSYNSENVKLVGFVSDEELASLYAKCKIVVAPLRYGAGIKGKIVEAMHHGLPVVTTSIGAEGLIGAEFILQVADEPIAFAKKITTIYNDPVTLDEISKNSIDFIKRNYSREKAFSIINMDLAEDTSDFMRNSARIGLPVFTARNLHEFMNVTSQSEALTSPIGNLDNTFIPAGEKSFTVKGFCFICQKETEFHVDYQYSYMWEGTKFINWHERMICPGCDLNGRSRAIYHLFVKLVSPEKFSHIYISEQATTLFKILKLKYPQIIGSEYLGGNIPFGRLDPAGLRNEDLTNLSFQDESFDLILSFDCLEHIPSYRKAIQEISRCLKPGGFFFFSVPFYPSNDDNIIRAAIDENNNIVHLLPEEYHGNPIDEKGSLCYYNFGWQLLDEIKMEGFASADAFFYWSGKFGYLGGLQVVFLAKK